MKPQKKGFCPELDKCDLVKRIAGRFMKFADSFTDFFDVYRYHNMSEQAKQYLAGLLMKAPRKNIERIQEYVAGADYDSCQHFISDSPWDYHALNEKICLEANLHLGNKESVLCIDESAFSKKGKASVGVSRQWNGRLGKVDNCQVGVFASLCDGSSSTLIDYRLFIPQEWIDSPERCDRAKIPLENRVFKTKIEHAYDMIEQAVTRGVNFGWVAFDAFYGRDSKLLHNLDNIGIKFVADIPSNQNVYCEDPKPYLPRRTTKTGRKFSKLQSRVKAVEVSALFDEVEDYQWSKVTLRDTTKGDLKVNAYRQMVYLWDGKEKCAQQWWLVMLYDPTTKEKKWFLSNANKSITLKTLVKRHAHRYWIERTFQDGKTSVGMADYQVRGWLSWHHHMSMVMLALLFMLKERLINKKELELLSCQDIVDLLNYYLPRKDRTEKAVLENMLYRHWQREKSIESAYRKQKMKLSIAPK